ncbi:hypothetical protein H0H93_009961 [Arthromyces matolae]|nr:hypothetical protein H0H93_009961 [Arthromyces matolae]
MSSKSSLLFEPLKVGTVTLQHRVVLAPLTRFRASKLHVPIVPLMKEYYSQRCSVPGTLLISEASIIAPQAGGSAIPRELTTEEVEEYVRLYAQAARSAVEKAGFDGVEIHGANGYIVDQFLQLGSNKRTDRYGGSIEGRSRFGLEVVDAVVNAIGPDRTAIRLSPWGLWNDMGAEDPTPQFSHFVSTLKGRHPSLAYLHLIEARVLNNIDREAGAHESCDFLREIWAPSPLISAGGYSRDSAIQTADTHGELVAFGRLFISNPDLPLRLIKNIPLSQYDRATFYGVVGDQEGTEKGYLDYRFAE